MKINDREFFWGAVVNLMDDEIREELHGKKRCLTIPGFFRNYCKKHFKKYGEIFEFAKNNPQV